MIFKTITKQAQSRSEKLPFSTTGIKNAMESKDI